MNFEDIFGENSYDYFEMIIEKFNLKPIYMVYQNNNDEIIVDEEWISPKTNSVTASRLFKFDINLIELINEEKRSEVLEKVLNLYVSVEDYEQASILRDYIQENNS
jgi:hypothetical protein